MFKVHLRFLNNILLTEVIFLFVQWTDISGNSSKIPKLYKGIYNRELKTYSLIQVILTVIKLLRLCLPHKLHVDLRVELPTLGQIQLKHTSIDTFVQSCLYHLYLTYAHYIRIKLSYQYRQKVETLKLWHNSFSNCQLVIWDHFKAAHLCNLLPFYCNNVSKTKLFTIKRILHKAGLIQRGRWPVRI